MLVVSLAEIVTGLMGSRLLMLSFTEPRPLTNQPSSFRYGLTAGPPWRASAEALAPLTENRIPDLGYVFTMFMCAPGPDGKPREMRVMEIQAEKQ